MSEKQRPGGTAENSPVFQHRARKLGSLLTRRYAHYAGEKISMKKTKTENYLKDYYGSNQTTSCSVRVVLDKAERPALKEQKKRKGLYALGSN
ncbi:MAG: hypothetical protein D3925_18885 [Candidatus Electrothrix sp. AR5]|nr:hypothetical protein [Candidatus Electrothrix sp. AR5]